MSRIICIIGNKGGTGKTTLSHMLCQGFGLLGQRSACVLTDSSPAPLSPAWRGREGEFLPAMGAHEARDGSRAGECPIGRPIGPKPGHPPAVAGDIW